MVHLIPHAIDIGFSARSAAISLSIIGASSIIGKIGLGSLIDRTSSRTILIIAFIIVSISFPWLMISSQLWMIYVFSVFFGIAYGGLSVVQSPIIAEYFGLKAHGAIFGLAVFIAHIGAISPIIAGRIFDLSESYTLAFLICALFGLAGLILSFSLKPIRQN
jgi:MFS family permease